MSENGRAIAREGVARRSVLRAAAAAGGVGMVGLASGEGPDVDRSEPKGETWLAEVSLVHEHDGTPMRTEADGVGRYVVDRSEGDLLLLPTADDATESAVTAGEHTVRASVGAGEERFLDPGSGTVLAGEDSERAYTGPGSFVHLRESYSPPAVRVRAEGSAVTVETAAGSVTADAGEVTGQRIGTLPAKAYSHPGWEEIEVEIRARVVVRNHGALTVRRAGDREAYRGEPATPAVGEPADAPATPTEPALTDRAGETAAVRLLPGWGEDVRPAWYAGGGIR